MQFSIIVPVYNVAPFLAQCLDSVTGQTFSDYEVWVVDDGSTDGSGVICDRYAQKDSRVHVIRQENQGLSGARNTGLQHAQGQWIAFVDSDDWISTDYLEVVSRRIQKTPAELYCFNSCKMCEDGTQSAGKLIFFPENDGVVFRTEKERYRYYIDKILHYQVGWEAWHCVFSRSLIEQHGLRFQPTQEVFAEDLLFNLQYALYVKNVEYICNILYFYRQRGSSLLGQKKLETILPRIQCLTERFYETVCREKRKLFVRSFWELHFYVLNFQIQFTMKDVPEESLAGWLKQLESNPRFEEWSAPVRMRRTEYRKEMVNRPWL